MKNHLHLFIFQQVIRSPLNLEQLMVQKLKLGVWPQNRQEHFNWLI